MRLESEAIAHIFTSTYRRTLETAMPVAATHGLFLKLEPGLGEWQNPDWMPGAPELTNEPLVGLEDCIDRDYQGLVIPDYPEGRSPMLARAGKTMKLLLKKYAGNLLVVGHKDPLIGCAIALLGRESDFSFDVCGISEFTQIGDHWGCTLVNDQNHLSEPGVKVAACDDLVIG